MKKNILLVLSLFISVLSIAQKVFVVDHETHHPLGLVSIIATDQTSVITNSQGQAELYSLRLSEKLNFRLIGYENLILTHEDLKSLQYRVELTPKDYLLNQVVISAQRWSTEKAQLPTKVTGIKKSEVEFQNPQTAADLLNVSGEVFIQKSQMGGGSPMIRGYSANRLLLTVDGVRMNTAIFRSGNLQNVISLDPYAIGSTEVFFGPGSVIYGSDAIGGVMSFFTLKPKFSDNQKMKVNGQLDIRYSSANEEKTGHFNINLGWEKWALLSSFSHFNYDDLRMGKWGPDEYLRTFYVIRQDSMDVVKDNSDPRNQKPSAYHQSNFMQKIRFRPSEKWDFEYAFHYSTSSDVPRYDRLIRTKNGEPRSAEWYYGPQVWMMNLLSIEHHSEHKIYDNWSLKAGWQHFAESRHDRGFNQDIKSHQEEKVEALSLNFDLKKDVRNNDQIFYGFEVVYNNVTSIGSEESISSGQIYDGPSRYPQSDWSSYAAYVNYNWHPTEKWLINGGLRYNQYILKAQFDTSFYPFPFTSADINNSAVVGSLGLNYQPGNEWLLAANISTGFRAPNVDDMGKVFDSEPGSVMVPNPFLKAEYIYNGEIGVTKGFGRLISVDARVFYSLLENAMVRRDYTLNGLDSIMYNGEMSKVQAMQNAAYAKVWGWSLGIELSITNDLHFSSRYNYQKGEEEMDDGTVSASRHAAPMFGSSHLTYQKKKLKVDLYAVYSGEISYDNLAIEERSKTYMYAIDSNGNPYAPSWYTLNLKMKYELNELLLLSGGLENITNQRYRTYSSGISAGGLNAIFSLSLRF